MLSNRPRTPTTHGRISTCHPYSRYDHRLRSASMTGPSVCSFRTCIGSSDVGPRAGPSPTRGPALESEWEIFEEIQMAKTGLVLSPTALATTAQLGRRQSDWILVSDKHKMIANVDLCRPSDVQHHVHPTKFLVVSKRKQHTERPLLHAITQTKIGQYR